MKFDARILLISVVLAASMLALLAPLYGSFGRLTAVQTAAFVIVSVLAAYLLGKWVGERHHG